MIIILDEGATAYGDVSDSDLALKLKKSLKKNYLLTSSIDTPGFKFQLNFSECPIKGLQELDFFFPPWVAGGLFHN